MQTQIAPEFKGTPDGDEAEAILRKCVHCGFCTATCPTYQILGDELDGPRGRIYLMKQVLEGEPVTRATQIHLDRCLTCRNCETTCPSGVQYGNLVEIGRRIVEERVERPASERAMRWLLKEGLTSPLFAPAMKLGQALRPLLPATLRNKVPATAPRGAHRWPTRRHDRTMLMLAGCVQPAMMPNINSATARVLDAAGIQTVLADKAGCCGAIRLHLNDHDGGLADMRRNIDAWWPYVEGRDGQAPVEAIVMNASGCGVTVKDYGHALARDAAYADKARRIAELTVDLSELLPDLLPALKNRLGMGDDAARADRGSPGAARRQAADAGPTPGQAPGATAADAHRSAAESATVSTATSVPVPGLTGAAIAGGGPTAVVSGPDGAVATTDPLTHARGSDADTRGSTAAPGVATGASTGASTGAATPSAWTAAPTVRPPPLVSGGAARPGGGMAEAAGPVRKRLAFHPPCTLQHGQQLRGGVEQHLAALGFEVQVAMRESHLCCGSAGTYSVLQPEMAYTLRDRKLEHLGQLDPEVIVSANVGCIQHLQTGTTVPVRHWVEVLDDALGEALGEPAAG